MLEFTSIERLAQTHPMLRALLALMRLPALALMEPVTKNQAEAMIVQEWVLATAHRAFCRKYFASAILALLCLRDCPRTLMSEFREGARLRGPVFEVLVVARHTCVTRDHKDMCGSTLYCHPAVLQLWSVVAAHVCGHATCVIDDEQHRPRDAALH